MAVAASLGLQALILYTPLRGAFGVVALGGGPLALIAGSVAAGLAGALLIQRVLRRFDEP